jgi:predicted PurR-regulated permease PerM
MMDEQAVKVIDKEAEAPIVENRRLETYMQITAIATCIIVLAIASLLLYFIRSVVIIFALAFLAAYILSPAVRFFEKRRVNRVLIVSIFYVVFVAAVVVSVILLLPMLWNELKDLQTSISASLLFSIDPQFQSDLDSNNISEGLRQEFEKNRISLSQNATVSIDRQESKWVIVHADKTYTVSKEGEKLNVYSDPEFGKTISAKLKAMQDRFVKTFPVLGNFQFDIDEGVNQAARWILNYIGQVLRTITAYSGRLIWLIIVMILIPFITFFLLKDSKSINRAAMKVVPSRYSEISLELLQKIDRQIGGYIRGRLAESIVLSALTIIGLRILSIKYYLVIGGIAGFANLIPYIGPVMIAIPAVVLAGYQHGMFHMVVTGILFGVLQIVDNAILVPLVVGKSVDLHPVVTIFVVFVGGQLLGFLGMIVAVPLTSILIAIFQALYKEFKSSSISASTSAE